jgi:hypothetical protein
MDLMSDDWAFVSLHGARFKVSFRWAAMCRETGAKSVIEDSIRVECTEVEDPDLVATELLGLPGNPMDPQYSGVKRPDGEPFHQGEDLDESVRLAVDAELDREGDLFGWIVEAAWC